MPWNLLFLPLLGGYLYLALSSYHRFRIPRLDGNRLTLEAGRWAVLFLVAGRGLAWLITLTFPPGLVDWATGLFPYPFVGTAALSLACGPVAAFLRNVSGTDGGFKRRALEDLELHLLGFCQKALLEGSPVMLSMTNRKVYVGHIVSCPGLDPKDAFLGLIPQMSGFRDDELRVQFTTVYPPAEEFAEPERFVILLPTSVQSVSTFEPDIYQRYFDSRVET